MKTTIKLLMFLFVLLTSISANAQEPVKEEEEEKEVSDHSFIISPRIGYDIPFFMNNTPYIDYKGGLDLGISFDYYWKWIGVGIDFDYLMNAPKSTYPTDNLYGSKGLVANTSLSERKIDRFFYGIGPNFRWRNKNKKFHAELNTRAGLGHVNGGRVLLKDGTSGDVLNFHAGYTLDFKFATKLQLRATYYFNDFIGVNAGVYYIQHYGSTERQEGGYSSAYQEFEPVEDIYSRVVGNPKYRESCNCNIFSIGVFAGVSLKMPPLKIKKKEKTAENCKICDTYNLAVTARDKFTKEILPNTSVALKNAEGEVVRTGVTNSFGVVVFENILPASYSIEGLLHDVALDPSSTLKSEFRPNETLQKEIIYSNEEFILQGNAVVCNTTEGIPGVKVTLINKAEGVQKSTLTDNDGVYILHVKQNKEYTISGQKDQYFSQTETINTGNFDRNTTLFVKLEICMEKADCNKALKLKNINYDLDKYFIRPDAKPELNRLVQFMKDNPTLSIEVSSHTDCRSSHAYNQTLSQNRANAAVDYVVSQGIPRERISGVGYGETVLLNECADGVDCPESKHDVNRRTEMKVICPEELNK